MERVLQAEEKREETELNGVKRWKRKRLQGGEKRNE